MLYHVTPARSLNQEDRENLQFTTDGGGGEGESYGKVHGVFMKKLGDGLHNEVEKFVRDAVREGDTSYTISCLQKELDHTFEVNNGQGGALSLKLNSFVCFCWWVGGVCTLYTSVVKTHIVSKLSVFQCHIRNSNNSCML